MLNMQLKQIQIVFYLLALSGCAGTGRPNPGADPGISLHKETTLSTERDKTLAATSPQNDVYFSDDDTKVNERGQEVLRRHALRLREHPHQVVTLVGYTDPLGSRSYNLAVTEERMDSVVETLRSLGVARSQIRRINAGQTKVATASCDTPACRQLMQRVELIYER